MPLALNAIFLFDVKLKIIEIEIPPILERMNKEDVIKNRLKKAMSIMVAIPPVIQNKINFEKCLCFVPI